MAAQALQFRPATSVVVMGESSQLLGRANESAERTNILALALTDEQQQRANEKTVILKRAEVHGKGLTTLQKISRMKPQEIQCVWYTVKVYALAGVGVGTTVGFFAGGGPNPAGAAGAGIGAAVGLVGGGITGAVIYMIKSSKEFSDWRKDQTDESLKQFRAIFNSSNFESFLDPHTSEIMEFPTTDNHGCRADYSTYMKWLKSDQSKDQEEFLKDENGVKLLENGKKIPNPNYGRTMCIYKCHYITEDDLIPDYATLGAEAMAIRSYIETHPEFRLSNITVNQFKGLNCLLTDLKAKAKWAAEVEEDKLNQLLKDGKIKRSFMYERMAIITKALDL